MKKLLAAVAIGAAAKKVNGVSSVKNDLRLKAS